MMDRAWSDFCEIILGMVKRTSVTEVRCGFGWCTMADLSIFQAEYLLKQETPKLSCGFCSVASHDSVESGRMQDLIGEIMDIGQ